MEDGTDCMQTGLSLKGDEMGSALEDIISR